MTEVVVAGFAGFAGTHPVGRLLRDSHPAGIDRTRHTDLSGVLIRQRSGAAPVGVAP